MAKNRVHSRISDDLPDQIQREVDRLLVEGNATYDEIKEFLTGKGYDISRSAIGRYGKEFVARYRELKIIEDQSKTLISKVGDGLQGEEAVNKMFVAQLARLLIEGRLDVLEVPRLVSDFAKLQSSSVLRERLKMEFAKRVEKAADEVVKTAKAGGLSAERAEEIRKKILGIV